MWLLEDEAVMKHAKYFALVFLVAFSCGGKQTADNQPKSSNESESVADDLDVPEDSGLAADAESTGDPLAGENGATAESGERPAVTFKVSNSAEDDLVFSLDRGWQPVIFAFSGTPPNATPIVMFPKFCTASCDLAESEICPYCPQPERVKDIRAAEKREILTSGGNLEVPWDGEVYVYKKARGKQNGKRAKCECFTKEPVAPETYTVRACGLRISKSSKKSSKYQCVEGSMTFPSDLPQVVELEFPTP